jgi:hypothetical protein
MVASNRSHNYYLGSNDPCIFRHLTRSTNANFDYRMTIRRANTEDGSGHRAK